MARACQSDTLADDQAATVHYRDADHVIVTFPKEMGIPLGLMVRVNGAWKFDTATMLRAFADEGADVKQIRRFLRESAQVLEKVRRDVAAGKYAGAAEVADYIKREFDRIDPRP